MIVHEQEEPQRSLVPIGDAVAELRSEYPEFTHSSLRFLEREGLVTPTRTTGGHRLYSVADLDRIRQIKSWQRQRLSLDDIRQRLEAQTALGSLQALTKRFLDAALLGSPTAGQYLLQADDLGVPLVTLFQDVLQQVQAQVGAQWEAGVLRVGQEHEITEIVRDVIAELSLRHADPHPTGRAILAACVAGEFHDLGLRMIVALMRAAGQSVHFLGTDIDERFLVEEVVTRRPAVVLLSATMRERLPAVQATVQALSEAVAPEFLPIVVGGDIVRRHRTELEQWGVVPASDDDLAATLQTIATLTGATVTP